MNEPWNKISDGLLDFEGIGNMGHESYEDMLTRLVDVRDADYRSDPERHAARLDSLESIMQSMLEKLRDKFGG